jgi:predicted AlkP superfamily phosphohydrolase/phosphomutase
MEQGENRTKVMVLGFDGTCFNVLAPMIESGKLPNFARLMREGVSGDLKTTVPPISGPAWATFATGQYPGKHGIYDFFRNLPDTYGYTPINSSFFPSKTLWEILSERGKKVGVMNMLFTYPPKELNGFVISGRGTPGEDVGYTYPASLKEEILAFEPKYRVEAYRQISQTGRFLRLLVEQLRRQERVNRYLIRKYPCDFTASYFAVPDLIQHIFWKYLDPGHPHYNRKKASRLLPLIEECFATLDSFIGERLQMIDEDTLLFIVSDHGAGPLSRVFQLNRWLQEFQLLFLKENRSKRRSVALLGKMARGVANITAGLDVFGLRRFIGFKTREKRRLYGRKAFIEWSRTRAYAGRTAECGVFINLKGREGQGIVEGGEEYERLREQIISGLSRLRDPETGEAVFEMVCRREDIYKGPFVQYAPDIMFDFGAHPFMANDSLFADGLFETVPTNGVTGMHSDKGIIIARGRGIKKGAKVVGANICDLAPTILYLMNLEVAKHMEGRVLTELLESPPQQREIRSRDYDKDSGPAGQDKGKVFYSDDEAEHVTRKLKDLGYL